MSSFFLAFLFRTTPKRQAPLRWRPSCGGAPPAMPSARAPSRPRQAADQAPRGAARCAAATAGGPGRGNRSIHWVCSQDPGNLIELEAIARLQPRKSKLFYCLGNFPEAGRDMNQAASWFWFFNADAFLLGISASHGSHSESHCLSCKTT